MSGMQFRRGGLEPGGRLRHPGRTCTRPEYRFRLTCVRSALQDGRTIRESVVFVHPAPHDSAIRQLHGVKTANEKARIWRVREEFFVLVEFVQDRLISRQPKHCPRDSLRTGLIQHSAGIRSEIVQCSANKSLAQRFQISDDIGDLVGCMARSQGAIREQMFTSQWLRAWLC